MIALTQTNLPDQPYRATWADPDGWSATVRKAKHEGYIVGVTAPHGDSTYGQRLTITDAHLLAETILEQMRAPKEET